MKKNTVWVIISAFLWVVCIPGLSNAVFDNELVLMDFDSGDKPNNVGGDFGAWDKDPADSTQTCEADFEYSDDALGNADGFSLRLDYDVDYPNPAYNGFWAKLEGEDFSAFNTLRLAIKGDANKGYPARVKVELKNTTTTASYLINGISDEWQTFSIPFSKFKGITDWAAMNEFVIVFDDINTKPKVGSILVDQVCVTQE